MAVAASKPALRELFIRTPDGKTQTVPLDRDRLSLGRSSTNELCFPDDSGLSRQHLAIESDGAKWLVRDLGSKNGTFVNGNRINEPHAISVEDRITAGHLTLEFRESASPLSNTVVFVENQPAPTSSTVITSLEGLLKGGGQDLEAGGHMTALIRAGRELAGHMPLAKLFELIMELSIDAVKAARGVLMTVEGDRLEVRAAKGEGFRISSAVRDLVIRDKRSLLVRDARLDEAFADRHSIVQQQIRSLLAVPLQTEDRVIGLIYLDSPHFVREFTKDDLNLLTVMANIAAVRVEHARLAEIEQAEKLFAKELEQAAEIQRGLLPKTAPTVAGVELAGYNVACRTVGGDYYDFLPYPDGRVAILVGDVAGKGMPAALLMSSLQARVQVLFENPDELASTMTRLNRIIRSTCPGNRFITFFVAVLNPATGEVTYCNGGHNPPLLLRSNGSVERLETTGLVLGILPNTTYEQGSTSMDIGDIVVLFSDGVTEAMRPDTDEEFGEERLAETLKAASSAPVQSIVSAVIRQVSAFTNGAPPADDVTVVVARRVSG